MPSLPPAFFLIMTRRAALEDGITKKPKDLWRRQATYAASRQKFTDAQMAIAENKRLIQAA